MRIRPDDEVYRVKTVWHGPKGLTFPWTARYQSYAMWLLTFLAVLLVEALTPLNVGIPPVWEICLTTLFTYAAMGMVDDERPIRAVLMTLRAEITAPRPAKVNRYRLDASSVVVGELVIPEPKIKGTAKVCLQKPWVVPDELTEARRARADQALGEVFVPGTE